MKESRLGPRRWAFVVLAGGAACAIPFLRSGPEATQNAPGTMAQPEPQPIDRQLPAARSGPASAAGQILSPPATAETLPAWASAQRSPFDELLGSKAVVSPPAFGTEANLPIEPLKPWVQPNSDAVPISSSVNETTTTVAEHRDGLRSLSDNPPDAFGSDMVASQPRSLPSRASATAWPDERISLEQIAQLNYSSQNSDLVSAIVTPPPARANSSTSLATKVLSSNPNPSLESNVSQGLSAPRNLAEPLTSNAELPNAPRITSPPSDAASITAAHSRATIRFGESNAAAQSGANPLTRQPPNLEPIAATSPPTGLTTPPDARRKSIIFQPSARP